MGVKWNADDGTDFTATLVTARAPVWGDFYAKDRKTDQVDNAAWNTGFLDADPLDLPANGSIDNHALVPDTVTTPVPEPGTLLLVGTGLASAGAHEGLAARAPTGLRARGLVQLPVRTLMRQPKRRQGG
jgi:hypothetical protein